MSAAPIPIRFHPLLQPRPWGGRALERLFHKPLPPQTPIGESWELVSLPGAESLVRDGPLADRSVSSLIDDWGGALLGGAALADGRFPLLIKFLDAREHLSVQVHPKPDSDDPHGWKPGIKHEAWYVLHAEPDAQLFIGFEAGVSPAQVAAAANTPRIATLLRKWPARRGDCFYLPSGTPHALGAGIVVAEVQTPSDVTYRLYDWERVGLDGLPRALHVERGLANIRYDVADEQIVQPRSQRTSGAATTTRVARSERFEIERVQLAPGALEPIPAGEMLIWIVLAGAGSLRGHSSMLPLRAGDTLLLPAAREGLHVHADAPVELLEVKIPIAGAGAPHAQRERRGDPNPARTIGKPHPPRTHG